MLPPIDPGAWRRAPFEEGRGMAEKIGGAGFPARGVAYLDGDFVPMEEAKISIATHAFNYGTGCFEGIRGYWNSEREEVYLVKLQKHFQRLLNSTRLFRIDIGHDLQQLCDVAIEVVRRTGYREDVYVRPIAYKASPVIKVGLLHLQDGFCCFSAPMGAYFDITRGLVVTVSGWRRNDDNAIPARAKATGGYINAALAIADAQEAGFDEAILLTGDGHVSEGSAANIFLVMSGKLVTPAVADDILVGITRGAILELAAKLGVPVVERRDDRRDQGQDGDRRDRPPGPHRARHRPPQHGRATAVDGQVVRHVLGRGVQGDRGEPHALGRKPLHSLVRPKVLKQRIAGRTVGLQGRPRHVPQRWREARLLIGEHEEIGVDHLGPALAQRQDPQRDPGGRGRDREMD